MAAFNASIVSGQSEQRRPTPVFGLGNVIQANAGAGITVGAGVGNSLRGNVWIANGGIPIDLWPVGATPNDPGDVDSGPNWGLNTPTITDSWSDAGATWASGFIDTVAGAVVDAACPAYTAADYKAPT